VSRLLAELGHEVLVANPRKLRLIYQNDSKSDRVDAEYLARVGRLDPALLAPLRRRGAETQADRALLRSRNALVRTRTRLISHARGTTKSLGGRLPACSAASFAAKAGAWVPDELRPALAPVLAVIAGLCAEIRALELEPREEELTDCPHRADWRSGRSPRRHVSRPCTRRDDGNPQWCSSTAPYPFFTLGMKSCSGSSTSWMKCRSSRVGGTVSPFTREMSSSN